MLAVYIMLRHPYSLILAKVEDFAVIQAAQISCDIEFIFLFDNLSEMYYLFPSVKEKYVSWMLVMCRRMLLAWLISANIL